MLGSLESQEMCWVFHSFYGPRLVLLFVFFVVVAGRVLGKRVFFVLITVDMHATTDNNAIIYMTAPSLVTF